ncbi:MAG: Hsp20/alpha crystallin family protein [Rhodospirillales bacterium]|nr:Hsp20/alpha crystallin family protein [Rhodospirillales bacterium]
MADTTSGTGANAARGAEATRNRPVFTPVADIFESEDALILVVELPGVRPNQIEVSLDKRVLTITGHGDAFGREGYSLALCEYQPGDFERAFTLSDMIDDSAIEAVLKDGVLRLTLPKAKAGPAKTINVKVG